MSASNTEETFQELVGRLDYPMFVVTAVDADDGEPSGCLVGFLQQCSIHPPRVMAWVSKKNHTYDVARLAPVLAVHVLAADQHDLARHFGSLTGDEVDKLAGIAWSAGPEGVPILTDCPDHFVGRVIDRVDTGDHEAFLLEPIAADVGDDPRPQLGFQAVKDLEPGHPA